MKKATRSGKRTFTIEELVQLLPLLQGKRPEAIARAKAKGLNNPVYVDNLRTILGYTTEVRDHYTDEQIAAVVKVFEENPDKSIYQLFKEYGKELCVCDYQAMYHILKRTGHEVNRKRNFWTPIKDKRLIYFREVKKMKFPEIAQYFGEGRTTGNVSLRYYKLKGKRTH